MRSLLAAVALLLISAVASADDFLSSAASVRQLMDVMQTRRLLGGMMGQMDSIMQTSMKQAVAGRTPTPEQQAILEDMRQKMVALMQQEMQWEKLEPQFIEIYRRSFTEDEVAGMVQFYKSPAGQAVINKMPVVMQHTMAMMQQIMAGLMPKMQKLEDEAKEKMKCCKNGG